LGRLLQVGVLLAILLGDLYFLSTGAVRPSLVVAQLMMILTVMILSFKRRNRPAPRRLTRD
jgi:hypothetical protein